jgi:hypothetical protein
MGKGSKTKREMVILIRKLKRNRALKKTGKKTFTKHEGSEQISVNG